MTKFFQRHGLLSVLFLFIWAAAAVSINAQPSNFQVIGLTTTNTLVRFNSSRPNTILSTVAITGLQSGESVRGIDYRPASGQLFALGSFSRIYRVDAFTGVATFVGTLTTPLSGSDFGFDFNPVPDRIRITSDAEQNLRANPIDGTNLVDGALAYAAGDPNVGANPNIVASAYTNSFAGATTTTLFNIDSGLDILTTQNPPNNGTLNTVGSLGINVSGEAGFDIAPGNNTALAAFQLQGSTTSSLYSINLATGFATSLGTIGGGVLRGIAIARSTASGAATATLDFDGDGRTDEVVFRPSNNTWYIRRKPDGAFRAVVWGDSATDILTPGDYDGDGRTDVAVWRTTNATFYIIRSSDNGIVTRPFGAPGDEPVARDYDGDGRTDYAVVRRTPGGPMTWFIQNSSVGGFRMEQFGLATDIVAPGDYDGDGMFDLAVRRGSGANPATFFFKLSTGAFRSITFGIGSDLVVPGDYDGDGITDVTALRAGSTYTWFVLRSSGGFSGVPFGNKPDLSAQGDYDGDGRTDIAVYDQVNGFFRELLTTTQTALIIQFGQNGDYAVANYDTH